MQRPEAVNCKRGAYPPSVASARSFEKPIGVITLLIGGSIAASLAFPRRPVEMPENRRRAG